MKREYFEWWVGLFIVLFILAALFLALRVSSSDGGALFHSKASYPLYAEFDSIGGLKPRARVTVAGVSIGRVANIYLDEKTYRARVTMLISNDKVMLPKDSSISILTSGLLGDNFLGITPGSDDENLKAGDELEDTHSALSLEHLVSQFVTAQPSSH